jgi:epoxide hydrolase-like predicted phosphatase
MSIRAVVFDMGGVLVRTENRAPRTQLAARLGLTYDELSASVFDSKSAHQAMKGEITTAEHWEAVRKTLGVTKEEFALVPLEFWGGDALDQKLIDYLRSLRPHYKTALLSNAWDDLRQMIEEVWMINDAFDEILISAEVGLVKPDRRIFERLISDLGMEPAEVVFVDDFPHNVEAAKAAGLEAIHFLGPDQALGELLSLLNGQ